MRPYIVDAHRTRAILTNTKSPLTSAYIALHLQNHSSTRIPRSSPFSRNGPRLNAGQDGHHRSSHSSAAHGNDLEAKLAEERSSIADMLSFSAGKMHCIANKMSSNAQHMSSMAGKRDPNIDEMDSVANYRSPAVKKLAAASEDTCSTKGRASTYATPRAIHTAPDSGPSRMICYTLGCVSAALIYAFLCRRLPDDKPHLYAAKEKALREEIGNLASENLYQGGGRSHQYLARLWAARDELRQYIEKARNLEPELRGVCERAILFPIDEDPQELKRKIASLERRVSNPDLNGSSIKGHLQRQKNWLEKELVATIERDRKLEWELKSRAVTATQSGINNDKAEVQRRARQRSELHQGLQHKDHAASLNALFNNTRKSCMEEAQRDIPRTSTDLTVSSQVATRDPDDTSYRECAKPMMAECLNGGWNADKIIAKGVAKGQHKAQQSHAPYPTEYEQGVNKCRVGQKVLDGKIWSFTLLMVLVLQGAMR